MPRLASDVYASYHDRVLALASKAGGISRAQIMEALNVSRAVADSMVKRCNLKLDRQEGKTEYFVLHGTSVIGPPATAPAPETKKEAAPEPKVVAVATAAAPGPAPTVKSPPPPPAPASDDADAEVSAIDHEIADTRKSLQERALEAGRLMGEWAKQQALVDALRDRLQKLSARRMDLTG